MPGSWALVILIRYLSELTNPADGNQPKDPAVRLVLVPKGLTNIESRYNWILAVVPGFPVIVHAMIEAVPPVKLSPVLGEVMAMVPEKPELMVKAGL